VTLDDTTTQHGGRHPLVLEVVMPDSIHELPLPEEGELLIGRSKGAGVRLDHVSVSREHARLRLGDAPAIVNLRSRNGTFVRGRKLVDDEIAEIGVGDPVEIGGVVIRLAYARPAAAPPAPRAERRAAGSGRALLDAPEGWYASSSQAMRDVQAAIDQVAPSDVSVLILGETGVGKEVCAEQIHRRSARAKKTLLRLNCSALPESLIESELFGHDKGAFTGAVAPKPGLIEAADGGTVFLDEIGELPLPVQAKLLRVLDRREVIRIGEVKERTVDVRFIAATHRSLEAEIAAGRFRQDLFYRLAGMTIRIPPLRERAGEIALLAARFAEDAAHRLGRPAPAIDASAVAALSRHGWPGNIRELRNVMERAVLVSKGAIEASHLSLGDREERPAGGGLFGEVEALERARVLAALEASGGNQSEAARRLGVSRGALLTRLRSWGLLKK
jgi:DNA-binding NtrC family response regulator